MTTPVEKAFQQLPKEAAPTNQGAALAQENSTTSAADKTQQESQQPASSASASSASSSSPASSSPASSAPPLSPEAASFQVARKRVPSLLKQAQSPTSKAVRTVSTTRAVSYAPPHQTLLLASADKPLDRDGDPSVSHPLPPKEALQDSSASLMLESVQTHTSPAKQSSEIEGLGIDNMSLPTKPTHPRAQDGARPAVRIREDHAHQASHTSSTDANSYAVARADDSSYRPFKPYPEIDKDSNLAGVVARLDSQGRQDRENGDGRAYQEEDEESSDGSEFLNTDEEEATETNEPSTPRSFPQSPHVRNGHQGSDGSREDPSLVQNGVKHPAASKFPMPPPDSPAISEVTRGSNGSVRKSSGSHEHSISQTQPLPMQRLSSQQSIGSRRGDLQRSVDATPSETSKFVMRDSKKKRAPPDFSEMLASEEGARHSFALSHGYNTIDDAARPRPVSKDTSLDHSPASGIKRGALREDVLNRSLPHSNSAVSLRNGDHRSVRDMDSADADLRRIAHKSNPADWIPNAAPVGNSGIHNLPSWDGRSGEAPRSTQNQRIRQDIDQTMRKLISEDLFDKLLEDPLGRHRFREFLVMTNFTSVSRLDMLLDMKAYAKTVQQLKLASEAVHDTYLAEDSSDYVAGLPTQLQHELADGLRAAFRIPMSMHSVQEHLLRSIYRNEFQHFIKRQLVEQTKVRLGKLDIGEDSTGLGDCFCLTNPRLRENPIVLVSQGFEDLTGYPVSSVIGYNCRFLQSSGTSPESVQRIRNALNTGDRICEILLNYRKDGTPFWNLLNIIPLRDTQGKLAYFLAGQVEVTGSLVKSKGLAFLLGGGSSTDDLSAVRGQVTVNGHEFSPTLSRHLKEKSGDNPEALLEDLQVTRAQHLTESTTDRRPRRDSLDSEMSSPTTRRVAGGYGPPSSEHHRSPASLHSHNGGGMMGKLTSKFRNRQNLPTSVSGQAIAGAEATLRRGAFNLDDQMAYFSDVYSKILVFKRHKREIIFVTPELLTFLGYRTATMKETYNSALIHADLLSILCGMDSGETKSIRANIKESVKKGVSFSIMCCIKTKSGGGMNGGGISKFFGGGSSNSNGGLNTNMAPKQDLLAQGANQQDRKWVTVHLTPLKDKDGGSFAFVGIIA